MFCPAAAHSLINIVSRLKRSDGDGGHGHRRDRVPASRRLTGRQGHLRTMRTSSGQHTPFRMPDKITTPTFMKFPRFAIPFYASLQRAKVKLKLNDKKGGTVIFLKI